MNHNSFIEKISLWLDDELNPAEVSELQSHLTTCSACHQTYQAMQQVHQFLHQASTVMAEPNPGFSTRFEARLAQPPAKRWRTWLGLVVLLISTLLLTTAGVAVVGLTLIGTGTALLNVQTFYEWLGTLGEIVNQLRAFVNLGGLLFKVAFIVISQPLFWVYVAVTIGLIWLWVRVIQMAYRRTSITVGLLV
jgi:hypothetical protein